VLNYAPTVIGESFVPCLVLVSKIIAPLKSQIEIYISKGWEEFVPKAHQRYIQEVVNDLLSRPDTDIDQISVTANDFSVGPLRLGLSGSCKQTDLHQFLAEIFNRSGYAPLA